MYVASKNKQLEISRFARLMDLYESNYISLRLLVPDVEKLENELISSVTGCLDLHCRVIEKSKYTTTINLTYLFNSANRSQYEPDLYVRIYHDARQAEAMSGLIHGQRHIKRSSRSLESGWKLNCFLHKWLRYVLYRGHKVTTL